MNDAATAIIKHLEKVSGWGGHSSYNVFDDWLDLVLATLEALPEHIRAVGKGEPMTDTPETEELFRRVRSRYTKDEYMDQFHQAFAVLLTSAWAPAVDAGIDKEISGVPAYADIIGNVYMQYNVSNKYNGQYFTPWNVAKCMADMSMGDIEKELHERVKDALRKSPLGLPLILAGSTIQDPHEAEEWFLKKVIPEAAAYIDPITVCDPCCGSGVMLLAAASACPRWAIDWGIVQFYGMDIDMTCVKMARVNCLLYGLNGSWLKCALHLSEAELAATPEPHASAYREAKAAQEAGDGGRVAAIEADLRGYSQGSLFGLFDQSEISEVREK